MIDDPSSPLRDVMQTPQTTARVWYVLHPDPNPPPPTVWHEASKDARMRTE